MEETNILTVSKLTSQLKSSLESEYGAVTVVGELSGFKPYSSGHWYFNLKDSDAIINCAMWKGLNQYVFFTPQDGMKVFIKGKVTVYPPRGQLQLDVRSMKPEGEGELQLAFERLKKKLAAEGLFDVADKKHIPSFPNRIGVATSGDGAALRDLISVAKRRYPLTEIIVAPCQVQGADAAPTIVKALQALEAHADIDLIIVGRGGGSIEDLWPFNEEAVARAIFACNKPVISAVGHEVDFTIADFVADLRAATPTAAMELATPDMQELKTFIIESKRIIDRSINEKFDSYRDLIERFLGSRGFQLPMDIIRNNQQRLDHTMYRLHQLIEKKLTAEKNTIELLMARLKKHDTDAILKKGFTYIKQNQKYIKNVSSLQKDQPFQITFHDGTVDITGKENGKKS